MAYFSGLNFSGYIPRIWPYIYGTNVPPWIKMICVWRIAGFTDSPTGWVSDVHPLHKKRWYPNPIGIDQSQMFLWTCGKTQPHMVASWVYRTTRSEHGTQRLRHFRENAIQKAAPRRPMGIKKHLSEKKNLGPRWRPFFGLPKFYGLIQWSPSKIWSKLRSVYQLSDTLKYHHEYP